MEIVFRNMKKLKESSRTEFKDNSVAITQGSPVAEAWVNKFKHMLNQQELLDSGDQINETMESVGECGDFEDPELQSALNQLVKEIFSQGVPEHRVTLQGCLLHFVNGNYQLYVSQR